MYIDLGRLRHEVGKLEASLEYISRHCLKRNNFKREIYCKELAHEIVEAEKSQNLPPAR
jgi:hypothetical protein